MISSLKNFRNEATGELRDTPGILDFQLPPALEAASPPEARGLARDEVRLMVSRIRDDSIVHVRFRNLPAFLSAGDVVVINTSGTMPAAIRALRNDGMEMELHLSTLFPDGLWSIELRLPAEHGSLPFGAGRTGEVLALPDGGSVTLISPLGPAPVPIESDDNRPAKSRIDGIRLWIARLDLPEPLHDYLADHGFPIQYQYMRGTWPVEYYQTVYATEPGSAEMPSAGRAFTPEIITRLVARGVLMVPLLLHTGVASLEGHEFPYEEYYHVPAATAQVLNMARSNGSRIVAVGTTVVRALETVTGLDGITHAGEGWTDTIITPERGVRSVDALITGMHEPRATHLAMLEALAGRPHLRRTYTEALRQHYLWHEFGDLHLILP